MKVWGGQRRRGKKQQRLIRRVNGSTILFAELEKQNVQNEIPAKRNDLYDTNPLEDKHQKQQGDLIHDPLKEFLLNAIKPLMTGGKGCSVHLDVRYIST